MYSTKSRYSVRMVDTANTVNAMAKRTAARKSKPEGIESGKGVVRKSSANIGVSNEEQ